MMAKSKVLYIKAERAFTSNFLKQSSVFFPSWVHSIFIWKKTAGTVLWRASSQLFTEKVLPIIMQVMLVDEQHTCTFYICYSCLRREV